ncbi:hypothetical protein PIB30_076610 [Stylosanthes scabra]|uniref:Uncharacterized protein n=1 Tax=Stylosanthes scabra TaxID=79078 RepID=A0ABU6RR50_9FABA|nr:hypothetical protein [Stylosanthes scabra]
MDQRRGYGAIFIELSTLKEHDCCGGVVIELSEIDEHGGCGTSRLDLCGGGSSFSFMSFIEPYHSNISEDEITKEGMCFESTYA